MKQIVAGLLFLSLAVCLLAWCFQPPAAQAATFLSSEFVSPADDIDDDVFGAGQRLEFRHRIGSDLMAAGNDIAILEAVGEDVFAAANQVTVEATIGDDLMAAGNTISIDDSSIDDVFVAGSNISLGENTTVAGDVYAAGQTIAISGTIAGSVRAAGDRVLVQPGARITGDLIVTSETPPTVDADAQVAGEVRHETPPKAASTDRSTVLDWVRGVLMWFVSSLVILYLFPGGVRHVLNQVMTRPLESFGIGMLWLLVSIPLVIFLLLTVLGIPLALVWGASTLTAGLMSMTITPLLLGFWLYTRALNGRGVTLNWQHVLLGAFAIKVLALVPIVGSLLLLILGIAVVGALGVTAWRMTRAETDIESSVSSTPISRS